jgi:hypothetical protein
VLEQVLEQALGQALEQVPELAMVSAHQHHRHRRTLPKTTGC